MCPATLAVSLLESRRDYLEAKRFEAVPAPLTVLDPPPGTFRICWNDGRHEDFAECCELEVSLHDRNCTIEGDWVVRNDEGASVGCVEEF